MISQLLHSVSIFSVLLPIAVGVRFYRLMDVNSKLVLLLLCAAAIPQLGSGLISRSGVRPFYNLYALVDGLFWAFIFFRNSQYAWVKRMIAAFALGGMLAAIFIFIRAGISQRFYNELVCLNSLLQVTWVLVYIYEQYRGENTGVLERKPLFWFSLGLLIYAPVTYFLFVFYNDINSPAHPELNWLWSIHHLINAGMYLIFSIGMYVNKLRTTTTLN